MVDNKILRFTKVILLVLIASYIIYQVYGLYSKSFKSVFIHVLLIVFFLYIFYKIIVGLYRYIKDNKIKK